MNQILVVNGRPFAGKKIFANKIAKSFPKQFELAPLVQKNEGGDSSRLLSYFSESEGHDVSLLRNTLTSITDSGKIAVVYCNNTGTKQLIDFAEEWGYSIRTLFVDADLNVSLTRFLSQYEADSVSDKNAEILSKKIVDLINEEKYSQHHISFDLVIKAKQIEKAGVKKVLKLFSLENEHVCAEVSRRYTSINSTSHTVGLQTLIYNQLKSYGMINSITILPLVNSICSTVDMYKSRIEEDL